MNFFGHATVALDHGDDPAFVFGTMLPDFAGMVGTRVRGARDHAHLTRGIELHHRTDDAFHGAPIFVDLCRRAVEELEARGVARAPARAVAHVGTELLLDGWLASNDTAVAAYRAALASGPGLIDALELSGDGGAERCQWLLSRLTGAPIPHRYNEPRFVTERLVYALAPRPRLALSEQDSALVETWLTDTQSRVHANAGALLASVRAELCR